MYKSRITLNLTESRPEAEYSGGTVGPLLLKIEREKRGNENTHTHFINDSQAGVTQAVRSSDHVTRTMFDRATRSLGTIRVMSKVALMAGSSQQGNALRASVACRGDRERGTGHKLRHGVFRGFESRWRGEEIFRFHFDTQTHTKKKSVSVTLALLDSEQIR